MIMSYFWELAYFKSLPRNFVTIPSAAGIDLDTKYVCVLKIILYIKYRRKSGTISARNGPQSAIDRVKRKERRKASAQPLEPNSA